MNMAKTDSIYYKPTPIDIPSHFKCVFKSDSSDSVENSILLFTDSTNVQEIIFAPEPAQKKVIDISIHWLDFFAGVIVGILFMTILITTRLKEVTWKARR